VLYDLQYPASIVETTRSILSSLWKSNQSFEKIKCCVFL
jgi:hypothetical protein